MEPVFAVECTRHVPNPFGLVHVAAARTRQLNRGAERRLNIPGISSKELALREIAAGMLTDKELLALLPAAQQKPDGGVADPIDEAAFIGRGGATAAEPLVLEAPLN
jgi:DNA-directed RNA polymerase subunit omega